MLNKIKLATLSLVMATGLAVGLFGFQSALAATAPAAPTNASKKAACVGLLQVDASQGCATKGSGVTRVVASIVRILGIIVGLAAIIMIIISGLKYVTSNGDASSVASAKTTLVYALIGLIVAALAQFLVSFVLYNASNAVPKAKPAICATQPNHASCKDEVELEAADPATCATNVTIPATDPDCKQTETTLETAEPARCATDPSVYATDPDCKPEGQ